MFICLPPGHPRCKWLCFFSKRQMTQTEQYLYHFLPLIHQCPTVLSMFTTSSAWRINAFWHSRRIHGSDLSCVYITQCLDRFQAFVYYARTHWCITRRMLWLRLRGVGHTTNNTIQIKLGWALFVTYTIIQSIMRSEMCSLHLTHPSVHTWSSGQPTVQRPGSSHGLSVGAGFRTHNLGLPRVSSPTLYPLGQRLPY